MVEPMNRTQRVDRAGLQVAAELARFIEARALPGTGVSANTFWQGFSDLLCTTSPPKDRALLARREDLQDRIDAWHVARRGRPDDRAACKAFLREIGYPLDEGPDFRIDTANFDAEIARIPGPQLLVPITNAVNAVNAVNARRGSLYDALHGTDAMGPLPSGAGDEKGDDKGDDKGYDKGRGARVVARTRVFLDETFPVAGLSRADARRYHVRDGALRVDDPPLENPGKFAGYRGDPRAPDAVLLVNHGLHVALVFDRTHRIGARDQAGLADVRLESAISVIMDCEDSVAGDDAEDKVQAYDNWPGLMQGALSTAVSKGGRTVARALDPDEAYTAPDGRALAVRARALMLVRNVGHLMTNPAILDRDGGEIHTSMEVGAFSRKDFIRRKPWIGVYEDQNVDIGFECGLMGRAQIGKGMWAMPDRLAAMLEHKVVHPRAGATCAWVPSPTAATLHALHYHRIDVFAVQEHLKAFGRRGLVDAILDIPLATCRKWTPAQITTEVENNAQDILGYVVRWIDQGIGCSKVPDVHDVGLIDGRPRHLPDLCPAHRQLAAPWCGRRG